MTLQTIPENLGYGGAHLNRSVLREILVELQNKVTELETGQGGLRTQVGGLVSANAVKTTVVSGGAAATDIAVAGIVTGDTLLGVVKLDFTLTEGVPNTRTWAAADLLSEASVTSDGNIQLGTTDTSDAILLVTWLSG